MKIDTIGVYTNNTPSGAFRSFGAMQAQFATDSHLDIVADKLGLDPFEIRRRNMMRDGAVTHTRQQLGSVSLGTVLEVRGSLVALGVGRARTRRNAIRSQRRRHARGLHVGARAQSPTPANPKQEVDMASGKMRGRGMAACWYGIARTATIDRPAPGPNSTMAARPRSSPASPRSARAS